MTNLLLAGVRERIIAETDGLRRQDPWTLALKNVLPDPVEDVFILVVAAWYGDGGGAVLEKAHIYLLAKSLHHASCIGQSTEDCKRCRKCGNIELQPCCEEGFEEGKVGGEAFDIFVERCPGCHCGLD